MFEKQKQGVDLLAWRSIRFASPTIYGNRCGSSLYVCSFVLSKVTVEWKVITLSYNITVSYQSGRETSIGANESGVASTYTEQTL